MQQHYITMPNGFTYWLLAPTLLDAIDTVKREFEPDVFMGTKLTQLYEFQKN
jgi:hypothetical protein